MTPDQFHSWMRDPRSMDAESIRPLNELTGRYPYFRSAQMLLAKNLKQESHIDQLNQLHLAAVCVPDRKLFYDYMHDRKSETTAGPAVERESEREENSLKRRQKETEVNLPDELIPEPLVYQLETAELPETLKQEETERPEPTALTFSQWLEHTKKGELAEEQKDPAIAREKATAQLDDRELIDRFLSEHPKREVKTRAEFFNPGKAAAKSTEEDFTVVSETLANIYFQQAKFELAAQAYRALSLKYPGKSSYFAARLREIDEKQREEN